MQRRELIATWSRQAAALALGALFLPRAGGNDRPIATAPRGDDPFTLGVASALAGADRVLLWTRLAPQPRDALGGMPDAPVPVRWELAEDERFSVNLRRGEQLTYPDRAHSAHVAVTGLPSDRRFFYRFHAGDATSPVGRTRTLPAADAPVQRLRLALASCQHYEQGSYALHREIAAQELDAVLFVGDYIYETTSPRYRLRPHEKPGKPRTLAGYRQRHVTYKLDADLRAAHAAHPWLLMWDDHEVDNDYAAGLPRREDLDARSFIAVRAAAYQAYFEHLPVAPELFASFAAPQMSRQLAWGRLADLWLLDTRQFRDVQACNEPGRAGGAVRFRCDELDARQRSLLGAEQERWLDAGLQAAQRPWRLLAQTTQIAPAPLTTPLGTGWYSDGWDGYPAARARLLASIARRPSAAGTVCLGGDVHRHVAATLRPRAGDPDSAAVASEIVTSSITSRGLSEPVEALMREGNPDIAHLRGDERGYVLLDLDAQRLQAEFRATAFPVQAQARIHTQARFVVEAGRAEPQRDA